MLLIPAKEDIREKIALLLIELRKEKSYYSLMLQQFLM